MQKSPTAYFFSMKKLLHIALFLLIGLSLQAANYTCQTNAGELRIHIKGESSTITHLTITGQLDGRDFSFINDSLSHLVEINLKDCTIAAFESRDAYLGNQTKFEANAIPANTFFGFSELSAIQLPQNTRKIGDYAFAGCENLQTIDWGSSLQEVGSFAFCDCAKLNAPLPNTLTKIGEYTFKECLAYTTLDFSQSALREIGSHAFLNCTGINSITFPITLQSLGAKTFAGCSSLTALSLPLSLDTIGEGCFAYCTKLAEVSMKSTLLTSLPPYLFDHCSSLTSLHAPLALTEIGEGAFYYCTALTNCVLPKSLKRIGDYAFAGCSWLVKLSFLPEGLQYIGRWPFYGMRMLFSAQIPSTVQEIGDHAFDSCTRLYTIMAYPTEPPLLGEAVFENVPQSECFLGVPDDSRSLYLNAPQWKEFNICNISGKDEIETDPQLLAYFEHATLIVKADEPLTNIALFTIDGRMIYRQQGETTETAIETQAYPGKIFILSVQLKSGEYRHLKLGRTN